MGASIGVGLGLRHVLPKEQALRVVSVIGDSTLVHSGLTGLAEMVYNPQPTGHLVLLLDNGATAMAGQRRPTRTSRHRAQARSCADRQAQLRGDGAGDGDPECPFVDTTTLRDGFLHALIRDLLRCNETSLIVARQPCGLAAPKIRQYERAAAGQGAICSAGLIDSGG